MKKSLLTFATIGLTYLSTPSVFANGLPILGIPTPPVAPMGGFYNTNIYGGVQGGFQNMKVRYSGVSDGPSFGGTREAYKFSKSDRGLAGGFLLGFQCNHNNWIMGSELELLFSSLKTSRSAAVGSFDYIFTTKHKFSLIPSLTLGRVVAERWLPYFKLGVAISRFESNVFVGTSGAIPAVSNTNQKKTKQTFGLVPAIGLTYAFNDYLKLRGEAAYEFLQPFSNNRVIQDISDTTVTHKNKVGGYRFLLAVTYKLVS